MAEAELGSGAAPVEAVEVEFGGAQQLAEVVRLLVAFLPQVDGSGQMLVEVLVACGQLLARVEDQSAGSPPV